jgi:hypothetical protein
MAAPSKYDQLRAMREARYEKPQRVTKAVTKRPRVTKATMDWAIAEAAKVAARGPEPTRPYAEWRAELAAKTGRPRKHLSSAAKQRAYRERKAMQAAP